MTANLKSIEDSFAEAGQHLARLRQALRGVIVGQAQLIDEVLIAVVASGHVLMEGLPGLGKTHLAKGLARALGLRLGRVQCTPDLMPADITGSELLSRGDGGQQDMTFRAGPIFANLVLVDEINRATPKTQAALLEAMQERQVTYAGNTHRLPDPFWIIATQNPIEIEGTYPLPEAQLDRFLVKVEVHYPSAEAMLSLLDITLDDEPTEHMSQALEPDALNKLLRTGEQIHISDSVKHSAIQLILSTQPGQDSAYVETRRHIRYGASPRALQALLRTARVHALLNDRLHVGVEDLRHMALPVLRHRVLPTIESELEGTDMDALLTRLVDDWAERQ